VLGDAIAVLARVRRRLGERHIGSAKSIPVSF